jgi:hypothetical protein
MPQFKRSVNCPGTSKCPICNLTRAAKANKETPKYNTQKKFAINIINRATNRVEILDQGKTFFEDLRDVRTDNKKHGDLSDFDVKVRRRGTTKDDTSYRIDIDEVYELSADDADLVATAVNLDEYFRPHPPEAIARVLAGEPFDDVMKDVFGTQEEESASTSSEEFTVE